ncbi:hypothetical protein bcgnr5378_06080 [Bacillus cereus]|uniref:Uncharacterized protein n=1 Tax=Bacillus cereus TaxID=1396 RepID=A0A164LB05_BACCE|nr:hypothetical protein [Bacillus cereus]KZD55620.1 hypothetical protein B4088_5365 [Bacillus cereus]
MKYVEQKYQKNDIQVRFTEDEDAAFYKWKDGDTYYLCIKILVHSLDANGNRRFKGRYFREFEEKVTSISYNKFVQNFLEDPEFREQYHTDGEKWTGIIAFKTEKGVNQKCESQIRRLNKTDVGKLKFKDFAGLKTFGLDGFSRAKYEKLMEIVEDEDMKMIEQAFADEKLVVNALRWTARGLAVGHAVRKVKTDLEIQQNMR